jgi:hypothetical protein
MFYGVGSSSKAGDSHLNRSNFWDAPNDGQTPIQSEYKGRGNVRDNLGRNRVLLLVRGELEIPNDPDGIEYHSYKNSVLELDHIIESFLLQLGKKNE